MAKLIVFHGRECPHCKVMLPLVAKLEKETGIVFDKYEVWHDEKNADLMRSFLPILGPQCGGQLRVPAFLNTETKDAHCGEMSYEDLKAWASA